MTQPAPDDPRREAVDGLRGLPIDPDVDPVTAAPHPFPPPGRRRWPRIHRGSVVAVAAGGFAGGIARYGAGLAWPSTPGGFPWGVFAVNTGGAFVLALLLVLVLEALPPTTYLRPAIGTGFCGALTTFGSVVTDADRLAAHGHVDVAVGYVAASVVAGLAAASLGIVAGRSVAASRYGRE